MRVTSTFLPIFLLFTVNISSLLFTQNPSEWRQVIDKNNVEVYIHHCHDLNVRAFRAVTTVNMSLDSLEGILDRVEEYPNWQESVKEARIMHQASDNRYHFYTRNHQGWPVKDRALMWAVEKTWDQSTSTLIYDMVCSTNTLPEKNNHGIASQAFVSWRLQPVSETEVRISYNFNIHQGGRIPNWLLSMLNAESPYKTLANLKDREIKGDGTTASMD